MERTTITTLHSQLIEVEMVSSTALRAKAQCLAHVPKLNGTTDHQK
ncbi:hypothetical protein VIBNIBLFn1_180055 [Vibrio nigripulchritudo BLFn1]|nr:hypothetical protein VIBNIBLFn1_180055 [Vibrio nigripulchritudo BLFn1]